MVICFKVIWRSAWRYRSNKIGRALIIGCKGIRYIILPTMFENVRNKKFKFINSLNKEQSAI